MTHHIQRCLNRRRGALLLVVLSMLILFLMLGTVLVTHATRSRTAAASFAAAVSASSNPARIANQVLDEALMQLIRGKATPDVSDFNDESILADKYSAYPAITGTAIIKGIGPLITVEFAPNDWELPGDNLDNDRDGKIDEPTSYLDLGGRILTFLPKPNQVGTQSSYRIIRAEPLAASAFKCYLVNHCPELSAVLPETGMSVDAILNNPEFPASTAFAEPFDSFTGDSDQWLTRFTLSYESGSHLPLIERASFQAGAQPTFHDNDGDGEPDSDDWVDNDGDGIPDSEWRAKTWVDTVFPPPDPVNFPQINRILPSGDLLRFDISYMVCDLDSRLNVNAHGSLQRAELSLSDDSWGDTPADVLAQGIGPGFGWGVGDLSLPLNSPADKGLMLHLLQGMPASTANFSPLRYLRDVRLPAMDGRYGEGVDAGPATQTGNPLPYDEQCDRDTYQSNGNPNPLIDLKAMIKVFVDTTKTPPVLEYRLPVAESYDNTQNLVRDPYEVSLTGRATRNNSYRDGTDRDEDNLFSASELERLLRMYDNDANILPQRLAGLLADRAEPLRMLVTTDSWDTPGLTGEVATRVIDYFKALRDSNGDPLPSDVIFDLLSPDLAAGLRFDINRPFSPLDENTSREDFSRHLYCLLVAIEGLAPTDTASPIHQKIAQWVANICDYRDSDSTSTRFVYDTDLTDGWGPVADARGWDPTNHFVLGTERPDLVIAQTYAWREPNPEQSGLFVTLYRPAQETLSQGDGDPQGVGFLDSSLAGPEKHLNLGGSIGGSPIWRLRYLDPVAGESYVRFDSVQSDDNSNVSFQNSTADLEIPPDGFVCIFPLGDPAVAQGALDFAPEQDDLNAPAFFRTLGVGGNKTMGFRNADSGSNYNIFLERLANPEVAHDETSNPYVVVDTFKVKHESKPTAGNDIKAYRRCPKHFWLNPLTFDQSFGGTFSPLPRGGRGFLLWPNRPFISNAELALVPASPPQEAFSADSSFDFSQPGYGHLSVFTNAKMIVNSTIVPSRFRGTADTIEQTSPSANQLSACGRQLIPYRQLSRYREPGRVNINTMPMTNYGPNAIAQAVIGSNVVHEFFGSAAPYSRRGSVINSITSEASLLGLGEPDTLFFDHYGEPSGGSSGLAATECICKGPEQHKEVTQRELFPLMGLRTAIRLGNVATIRSNVFAVWITARVTNTTTGVETSRRLFAIVDRSLPVAFSPGEDLNSRNIIRVKRYLE